MADKKPWKEMTEYEIAKIHLEKCMHCPYSVKFSMGSMNYDYEANKELKKTVLRIHGVKEMTPEIEEELQELINAKMIACNYIGHTEHMRGCRPDECTHHLDKKVRRKKMNSLGNVRYHIEDVN